MAAETAVKETSKAVTPSQLKAAAESKPTVRSAVVDAMAAVMQGKPATGTALSVVPPATNESLETTEFEEDGAGMLQVDEDLIYILSTPRGHDGKSEKAFCNWIITRLNKLGLKPELAEEGAIFVRVGEPTESKTLFCCHVDTTHSATETEQQKLVYDPNFAHIMLAQSTKGSDPKWKSSYRPGCLGADDGAGVWLLLKMIEGGIKGGYLFHRGEERGCISSSAMANKQRDWLKQWNAAIAFDRPKDFEVIYRQSGVDCASITYTEALAKELSSDAELKLKFQASPNGGTTDTRNYRFVIPECVNVAVGYVDHHSADETLDYEHLSQLLKRCLALDWSKLPITRDPAKTGYSGYTAPTYPRSGGHDPYDDYYGYGGGAGYGQGHGAPQGKGNGYPNSQGAGSADSKSGSGASKKDKAPKLRDHNSTLEALYDAAKSYDDIIDWFDMDPDLTAKCVMLALIEGRNAQIAYNMLLSKTIKP